MSPLAVLLVPALACSPSTAPEPGAEAGRYVAAALGARALPAPTDSSAVEYGILLADTLELDGRGGAHRVTVLRRVDVSLHSDATYRSDLRQAYAMLGTKIQIGSFQPCPANAICAPNDTGTVTGGGLVLASLSPSPGLRRRFERTAP